MTDFSDQLKTRLDIDDQAFLESLEQERGLFQQLGDSLNGRMKVWSRLVFIIILVLTGVLIYAVWQMFHAETTRVLILWTAGAGALLFAQGMAKNWMHNRMNMLTVLRELKRVELRLAQLEERRG